MKLRKRQLIQGCPPSWATFCFNHSIILRGIDSMVMQRVSLFRLTIGRHVQFCRLSFNGQSMQYIIGAFDVATN